MELLECMHPLLTETFRHSYGGSTSALLAACEQVALSLDENWSCSVARVDNSATRAKILTYYQ